MTHVTMFYQRNIVIGFRMEGHAGFNLKGPDVLCASLSAVSQMTVNGVLDWTGLSVQDAVTELDQVKGLLEIKLPDNLHENMTVQQMFRSFEMYITDLCTTYGKQFITIERSDIE